MRSIINNDSWFKSIGIAKKNIPQAQRICAKKSCKPMEDGNEIYTDVLIWEYYTTSVSQGVESHEASMELRIKYNITIIYNYKTGEWSDLGPNSGSLALRKATVGIKTTGIDNNDFYHRVEQHGAFVTPGGPSQMADVLKKFFVKIVPHGSLISTAVDQLSTFIDSRTGDYDNSFGVLTYSDIPSVHYEQNDGYVRSVLLNSDPCTLRIPSHYLQQIVSVKKAPNDCIKYFTYQSHYEVSGVYNNIHETLYEDRIAYHRVYT